MASDIPWQYGAFLRQLVAWLRKQDAGSDYVRALIWSHSADPDRIVDGRYFVYLGRLPRRRVELGFHREVYRHREGSQQVKVFSVADKWPCDQAFDAEWRHACDTVQGTVGYDEEHDEYFIERVWAEGEKDYDRLLGENPLVTSLRDLALQVLRRLPRANDVSR